MSTLSSFSDRRATEKAWKATIVDERGVTLGIGYGSCENLAEENARENQKERARRPAASAEQQGV